MKVIHPLEPIYNNKSKILLLGSMPSVTSRERGFYYAHPQNRFWLIFEYLFNVPLKTIDDKKDFLLKNNIALWDAFKVVDINSSSDASIKNYVLNDIEFILKNSNVFVIFCIGKTSYNAIIKSNINIPIYYLPSTSSANASKRLDDLINDYQIILSFLNKKTSH